MNLEELDISDDIIRAIENDYGRGIARIPYFERANEPYTFNIKIIFSDFRLMEGKVIVVPYYDMAQVMVEGIYY
jgi:hypothetical protein